MNENKSTNNTKQENTGLYLTCAYCGKKRIQSEIMVIHKKGNVMDKIIRDRFDDAFFALTNQEKPKNRELNEKLCRCDPEVGVVNCEYCDIFYCLKGAENEISRLDEEVAFLRATIKTISLESSSEHSMRLKPMASTVRVNPH